MTFHPIVLPLHCITLQSVEMMRNTSYTLLYGICNQSYILVAPTIMTMPLLMRMSARNVVLAS